MRTVPVRPNYDPSRVDVRSARYDTFNILGSFEISEATVGTVTFLLRNTLFTTHTVYFLLGLSLTPLPLFTHFGFAIKAKSVDLPMQTIEMSPYP